MAYLLIYEGDVLKEQHALSAARTTIGRAKDNDIVLAGTGVSGHHAVVEKQGQSFYLLDNSSSNGVLVDGKRVRKHPLRFWEEIQIHDYVLKFRARARLPGEQDGELSLPDKGQENAATTAIDVSGLRAMIESQEQKKKAREAETFFLTSIGDSEVNHPLDKLEFSIGKSSECDVRTSGWFSPRVAARIKRHSDAFYVCPQRRGKTKINGRDISDPTPLSDGDYLLVRGMLLVFGKRAEA